MKPHKDSFVRRIATEEALVLLRAAERDRITFQILRDALDAPIHSICFHAQQMVEKSLKAALVSYEVLFRRTHDLNELAEMLVEHEIPLPIPINDLQILAPCAVVVHYEDLEVTLIDRDGLTKILNAVRDWVDLVLKIDGLDMEE